MEQYLLIIVIVILVWGMRLIRIDLKKLEDENFELRKSNAEMLEANHKLIRKYKKDKY